MGVESIDTDYTANTTRDHFKSGTAFHSYDDDTFSYTDTVELSVAVANPGSREWRPRVKEWLVLICISILTMLVAFDATMVIPFIPVSAPRHTADSPLNDWPGLITHVWRTPQQHPLAQLMLPSRQRSRTDLLFDTRRGHRTRATVGRGICPLNSRNRSMRWLPATIRARRRSIHTRPRRRGRGLCLAALPRRKHPRQTSHTLLKLCLPGPPGGRHPRPGHGQLVVRVHRLARRVLLELLLLCARHARHPLRNRAARPQGDLIADVAENGLAGRRADSPGPLLAANRNQLGRNKLPLERLAGSDAPRYRGILDPRASRIRNELGLSAILPQERFWHSPCADDVRRQLPARVHG